VCAHIRFSDAGNDGLTTRSFGRRPKSAKARNRGGGWYGGGAAGYGDLAARSSARVMKRGRGETDFAWQDRHDWEHERAAGVLHDEILSVLVVIAQPSDVATRASTVSAEAASAIGAVAQ
jgi:hypothetical protein